MAETPSNMLELGTEVPAFSLPDVVSGRMISDAELSGVPASLVMFICNHCPFVKHVVSELTRLGSDYGPEGVKIIAINSNDIENYPQDGPPQMKALAEAERWAFPFLLDESQEVAQAFRAACTPDFYVFDAERRLAYRGQLDDSRPSNGIPVTGKDLRAALDALLAGTSPSQEQRPSIGCNIKWRTGR